MSRHTIRFNPKSFSIETMMNMCTGDTTNCFIVRTLYYDKYYNLKTRNGYLSELLDHFLYRTLSSTDNIRRLPSCATHVLFSATDTSKWVYFHNLNTRTIEYYFLSLFKAQKCINILQHIFFWYLISDSRWLFKKR